MADRRLATRVLAGLTGLPRAFVKPADAASGEITDPAAVAFEQGRLEGLEAGAAQATEELRAECDELRRAISETVGSLVDLRTRITRRHEETMIELALAAASRMLRDKIEDGDPVAARALREALAALPESGPVNARLHPADIESIRRDLAHEIDAGRVVLSADDTIGRGGCIVDSDVGTIDATIETAAATVGQAVTGTSTP